MSRIPDNIWDKLMQTEGRALTDDESDRGGLTKFGISKVANPDIDVANLTEDEAREIYEERYWNVLDEDDQNWDSFQRVVHQGVSAYNKAKGLSEEDRVAADVDKFIRIAENDSSQRKYLNGWINRALGTSDYGSGKVDLRELSGEEIREQVAPKGTKAADFNFEERLAATPVVREQDAGLDAIRQRAQGIDDPSLRQPDYNPTYLQQSLEDQLFGGAVEPALPPVEQSIPDSGIDLAGPTGAAFTTTLEEDETPDFIDYGKEPDFIDRGTPDFIDRGAPEEVPEASFFETIERGVKSTSSMGLSDEIEGAANSVSAMLFGTDEEKAAGFRANYIEGRDAARERDALVAKANPKTSIAAQIAGGVSVLPSVSSIKGMTAMGAAEGIGLSEEEDVAGLAKDAAIGGALAGTVGLAFKGAVAGYKGLKGRKATKLDEEGYEILDRPTEAVELEDPLDGFFNELSSNPLHPTGEAAAKGLDLSGKAMNKAASNREVDELVYLSLKDDKVLDKILYADDTRDIGMAMGFRDDKEFTGAFNLYANETDSATSLMKYGQDELKEMAAQRKELKLEGEDPATVTPEKVRLDLAAARLKTDIVRYMGYVTGETDYLASKYRNTYKTIEAADTHIMKLQKKFEQARKSGMVSEDSYMEFKRNQYMMESAGDIRDDYIARGLSDSLDLKNYEFGTPEYKRALKNIKDSLAKSFDEQMSRGDLTQNKKTFYETNMAFRDIDAKSGTDLEMIQNSAASATHAKTAWEVKHLANISKYQRLLRNSKYTTDEVYDFMKAASEGKPNLIPEDAAEMIAAVQKTGYELLVDSRKAGLSIDDMGEYYLPHRKKVGASYVRSMEQMFEDAKRDTRFVQMLREPDEKLETILEHVRREEKELVGFVIELKKLIGKKTVSATDVDQLFRSNALRDRDFIGRTVETDAGALHTRSGTIPDFLLEKDIGKLFTKNISEAGTLSFIEPVARQLDGRIEVLKMMGKRNAAEFTDNYRKDITGQFRKGRSNRIVDIEEKKLAKDIATGKVGAGDAHIDRVDGLWNLLSSSIYPNLVGLNPVGVTRNLMQPLLKTIPELGGYPPAKFMKAYQRAYKRFNWKGESASDLEGITSTHLASDLIDQGTTVASKSSGVVGRGIKEFNDAAMYLFTKSDSINRLVTDEISKDIAFSIRHGDVELAKHFPPALKMRALRVARNGRGYDEGFDRAVTDHMLAQTQLIYGKAGNSEFVRDSNSLVTMMTKWPSAILTDINSTLRDRKEFSRFAWKYFAPLIGMKMISSGIGAFKEEEEQGGVAELVVGRNYGADFTPFNTLLGLGGTPPVISGGASLFKGVSELGEGMASGDEQTQRHGAKQIKAAAQQFIPVVGGIWKLRDRIQHAFKNTFEDTPLMGGRSEDWLINEEE